MRRSRCNPFDHGLFDIVVEDLHAPEAMAPAETPEQLVQIARRQQGPEHQGVDLAARAQGLGERGRADADDVSARQRRGTPRVQRQHRSDRGYELNVSEPR